MKLSKKFFDYLKSDKKVLCIEDMENSKTRYFYFTKMPYNENIEIL